MVVDTHCHLGWESYAADLDAVVENARRAGVNRMITIGIDLESSRTALRLAGEIEGVYCAVGIHPNDVAAAQPGDLDAIEAMLPAAGSIVALGETGLDFYRDNTPVDRQEEYFRAFIRMAKKHDLPLVIHCREAYDRCLEILREENHDRMRGVMHCYAGTAEQAQGFIQLGFLIAFGGVLTFKNAEALRAVAATVKPDWTLVETDSPFLAPHPYRGQRNEPAHTALVVETLASIHKLSYEDVDRITSRNACRLFGMPGAEDRRTIVYSIRDALYINLTNRCSAHCTFCPIYDAPYVRGHYLGMKQDDEPSAEEVLNAVGDPTRYSEIVFCGYGEPTLRWEVLKVVAKGIKEKGGRVRLNTNGHGSLIAGRDITPELAGLIDKISVSLNAANAASYNKIVRPQFGLPTFDAVKTFIIDAQRHVPEVDASIVGIPNLDAAQCESLARELGANFRLRVYNELG